MNLGSLHLTSLRRAVLGLGAATMLCVMAGASPVQDREAERARAQARVTELFRFRINVMLEDLGRNVEMDVEAFEAARTRLHAAADAFCEAHPAKVQSVGSISWSASPIKYEPFRSFMASDGLAAALEEGLSPAARTAFIARSEERALAVAEALAAVIDVQVAKALCLTSEERAQLGDVVARAAQEQVDDGLIERRDTMMYYGQSSKEAMLELMKSAGLPKALAGERAEAFGAMLRKGRRTTLNDWVFEAEYLLREHPDKAGTRDLLRGGAEAILRRGGRELKKRSSLMRPVSSKVSKDWDRLLLGVLDLPEGYDLSALPSRNGDAIHGPRADFLLAVLDARACFSDEQREAIRPLIAKFVEQESDGLGDGLLLLPSAFQMGKDGVLIPGDAGGPQGSTKVRAMVKTLFENCSEDQKDVMTS